MGSAWASDNRRRPPSARGARPLQDRPQQQRARDCPRRHRSHQGVRPWLRERHADDELLASTLELRWHNLNAAVTLLTRDRNLQNRARQARVAYLDPEDVLPPRPQSQPRPHEITDPALVPADPAQFGFGDPVNIASDIQPIYALPLRLAIRNLRAQPLHIVYATGGVSELGPLNVRPPSAVPPHATVDLNCSLTTVAKDFQPHSGATFSLELSYRIGGALDTYTLHLAVRYLARGGWETVDAATQRTTTPPDPE
jgi:hypothetical protein